MEYKLFEKTLGKGISFNYISTDKFKSNLLTYYITLPLKRNEVTLNALLPMVLKRGTMANKTNLEIERRLEELYGARFIINIGKRGNSHILKFSMEFVKDSYLEKSQINDVVKFILDMIEDPLVYNGSFKEEYVNQEKKNLKRRIESKVNDKRSYAMERCLQEMSNNESIGISNIGYIEDLENINGENLYAHYKKIIETSPIKIFFIGEGIEAYEDSLIPNIKRSSINDINILESFKETDKTKIVREAMDISQGKLVLGYRTDIDYYDKLYEASLLAVEIFGGSGNSKLFYNVREKESLAYYISARNSKYNSIMILDAGIEFDKYDRVLDIIERELKDLKSGNISKKEIDIAKKSLESAFLSITDNVYSISEYFFSALLFEERRSIGNRIEDILKVSKSEIIEAAKRFKLDTIYFLENKEV